MDRYLINRGTYSTFDLMTRLLEEYNMLVHRDNHRCITIDMNMKPKENESITYPLSGFNKDNINVSKSLYNYSFYRHAHRINRQLTFDGFYILFERNSLYILTEGDYRSKSLESVYVFYLRSDENRPVFIVLNFRNISSKCFSYTDLINYFKNSKSFINTTILSIWDVNNFSEQLKSENDQIDDKVTYMIEYKTEYSYKVKVEHRLGESDLSGFTKYTHTPQRNYTNQMSLVLYKGEKLMEKKGNEFKPIEDIQNIVYLCVTVYFGKRDPNIPLIIKFTKSGIQDVYYSYKKDGENEYWEKWEVTKGITQDIAQLINKVKGEEANLSVSIYILIDKQKTYNKEEIEPTTGFKPTEAQPNKIVVNKKTYCKPLEKSHYKCYEHRIQLIDDFITNFSYTNHIILKLLIPNNNAGGSRKYSQLILYNGGTKVMEYINYVKNQDSLYVFFYDGDLRPHLVVYGNRGFSPVSKDGYYYIWYLAQSINSFTCDVDNDKALLDKLGEVSYFLYSVRLGQVTGKDFNNKEYQVQKYTNGDETTEIKTTVTSKDLNCCKKYTYTSNNNYIMGEISYGNNTLFTNFNEFKESINKYKTFTTSLHLYHYLYDYKLRYPLLVVLEFRNGTGVNRIGKEYYELTNKDDFKWKKIENPYKLNDQSELEKKLKEIRERLEIQYDRKPENLITKTASNCREDGNGGAVAGTFSILGLTAVGTGLAYYYCPEFFKKLYRRVRRLIPVQSYFRR